MGVGRVTTDLYGAGAVSFGLRPVAGNASAPDSGRLFAKLPGKYGWERLREVCCGKPDRAGHKRREAS